MRVRFPRLVGFLRVCLSCTGSVSWVLSGVEFIFTGLALCACRGLFPFWSPAFRSVSGLYLCYCESVSLGLLGSFGVPVSARGLLVRFCSAFKCVTTRVSRWLLVYKIRQDKIFFTGPVEYWSVVGSGLLCTASQLDPRRRVPCVLLWFLRCMQPTLLHRRC